MTIRDKDFVEKLLSLDERRCANEIAFAVGKWGVNWVFNVLIEIFEEMENDSDRDCCDVQIAHTKILLFKGLKKMFEPEENKS